MSINSLNGANSLNGLLKGSNTTLKQLLDSNPELQSIFPNRKNSSNQKTQSKQQAQPKTTSKTQAKTAPKTQQPQVKQQTQKTQTKPQTTKTKKQDKPLSTLGGNFYVGMTKSEAEKKGIYKKFMGTDFKDIDKNNDGKLSEKEILAQRDKQVKSKRFGAAITGGMSTLCMGVGALSSELGVGIPLVVLGGAGMAASNIESAQADKEAKITAQYRKQHNIKS